MTEKKPDSLDRRRATLQETDRQARLIIRADQESTRNKTKRLKAQRIAKESREGTTELGKKRPRKQPTKRQ